jgi:hypothetical protein
MLSPGLRLPAGRGLWKINYQLVIINDQLFLEVDSTFFFNNIFIHELN